MLWPQNILTCVLTCTFLIIAKPEDGTCGLNNAKRSGKILGGAYAKRGEFPFMVVLGYRNRRGRVKYDCGGTLITRYILEYLSHLDISYGFL